MAEGRVTFMPPPQVPGVSRPDAQGELMKQLAEQAGMGAGTGEDQAALAAPLLQRGIMSLQQAAKLDPRIAPLIERALAPLLGGEGSPELSRPSRTTSDTFKVAGNVLAKQR